MVTQIKLISIREDAGYLFDPKSSSSDRQLLDHIRKNGVLIPVILRPVSIFSQNEYRVVSGHRRFASARMLKMESIPAFIFRSGTDEVLRGLEEAIISSAQKLTGTGKKLQSKKDNKKSRSKPATKKPRTKKK